jgi:hypothetical protein
MNRGRSGIIVRRVGDGIMTVGALFGLTLVVSCD